MSRRREDHHSNDEAGAAYWAHEPGRDNDDNRPSRRELDRDEADAMDGTGYWGWWGR